MHDETRERKLMTLERKNFTDWEVFRKSLSKCIKEDMFNSDTKSCN